jgi:hypothetical protein
MKRCVYCNNEITGGRANKRFCNVTCRAANHKKDHKVGKVEVLISDERAERLEHVLDIPLVKGFTKTYDFDRDFAKKRLEKIGETKWEDLLIDPDYPANVAHVWIYPSVHNKYHGKHIDVKGKRFNLKRLKDIK